MLVYSPLRRLLLHLTRHPACLVSALCMTYMSLTEHGLLDSLIPPLSALAKARLPSVELTRSYSLRACTHDISTASCIR